MKEHKSHMSMVARFAYIFATLVTVFAQMGLAPVISTQAVTNPALLVADKNGYNVGDTLTITINATGSDDVNLHYDTDMLEYYGLDHNDSGTSSVNDGIATIDPSSSRSWPMKAYFKVRKDLGTNGTLVTAYDYIPSFIGKGKETEIGSVTITSVGNMDAASVGDSQAVGLDDVNLTVPANFQKLADDDYRITLNVAGNSALTGSYGQLGQMPAVAVGEHFTIKWEGKGLTPLQSGSDEAIKAIKAIKDLGFYLNWTNVSQDQVTLVASKDIPAGWSFNMVFALTGETGDITFTVTDDDGKPGDTAEATGPAGDTTPTDDPTTDNTTTEPTTDPDPVEEANNLTSGDLSLMQLSKSPYDLKAPIQYMFTANLDNYPTQYRDVQFKVSETDENGNATNQKAIFDPDLTKEYAESHGLSVSGPTDSEDHTVYTYSNGDQEYNVWVFKDNSIRVEFPKGTIGTNNGFLVMKANQSSDKVTLTPTFVGSKAANDDPVDLKDGTGFDFKINPSPTVDATGLRLDPQAVAPVNGETYHLSTFPLFYMKDDATTPSLYSFIYNFNSTGIEGGSETGSLAKLRKAIIDGVAYSEISGGAESTTSDQPGYFENFHAIDGDGKPIDGSEQPFAVDKLYTMIPYNPVAGTTDRFQRIDTDKWESKNYYMPDGIPTFSVDATGKITLQSPGDGKAIKGQWSADGSYINVKLYHVKQIKVVDQDGQPVPDATLILKNTAGSDAISLHGKTGDKGEAGDLYPSDNLTFNDTQPFYYPDGTQTFGSLDLPAGYTQDIAFTGMNLGKTDDKLSLTGEKNAEIVDNGQTLQLTVWHATDADSQVNIKKVDSADQSPLAGANFTVEETGNSTNDAWKTPADTTLTSGDDGMVSGISVDPDSTAKTRTFHITETKAPDTYQVANHSGYYATWTKGTGFTAVGETEAPKDAQSADGVVKIENGTLVFADSKLLFGGGGASSSELKFQYINSAGEPIAGAQLPTLEENHQYGSTDSLGISGIGGIIYNPNSDPTTLTTPDSGLVAGTGLAGDSTMATSQEKSDEKGMGTVQALWTQLGLSPDWESLSKTSNAYILSHAIMAGFLPNTPAMVYGLYNEDQQARQEATNASGYYSMGGTVQIGETNKVINASVASDNKVLRDNRIVVDTANNTVQVQLYKVKHIAITDANDKPIIGATVRFTNLVSAQPTDPNGEADLVPADNQGNATTSFAFPAPAQEFISAKDAQGNDLALGDNPTGFSTWMGDAKADQLASSGSTANIKISDGTNAEHAAGQYVELKTTTAQTQTVVRIHKQSATNADKAIAGVTFKVWKGDSATGTPVTTDPTDDDGNTTATFDTASSNDNYTIQENTVPDGFSYKQDTQTHTFSADDSGLVTGVKAGDSVISTDTDGMLHFADMPVGGGGVGENGTNGGDLTIEKVDLKDSTAKVPDGTVFTIKDAVYGGTFETTATVKNGVAVAKLGDPTDGDRTFTIQETTAPSGYDKNNTKYRMKIDKTGKITVGGADDLTLVDNHTPDNVITLNGYHLVYGDTKTVTGNNGGIFTLKKIDASNAVVTPPDGAEFTLTEAGTSSLDEVSQFTSGGLINFDLGKPTSTTRGFTLTERTAPVGYVWNTLQYAVSISPTGVVTVGSGMISSNPALSNQTSDKVVTANGKGVTFADDPVTTQKNGGELLIKKVDLNDRTKAVQGATFGLTETVNNDVNDFGTQAKPMTSDANGNMTVHLGQPTNTTRTLRLNEISAPSSYIKNSASYWIKIDPTGKYQVVGVDPNTAKKADPAATTPDQVLQVDGNNKLTFGDYPTASAGSFAIKKVDAADRTKAITTNLNNASFDVTEVVIGASAPATTNKLVGSTGLTSDFATTKSNSDLHLMKIQEHAAPGGYNLNTKAYYVVVSATKGVIGVSDVQDTGNTTTASSDGVVTVDSTDKHTVVFGDTKQADSSTALVIKKVDSADKTKELPNAKFTIEPATITNSSGIMGLNFGTAVPLTTDADGLSQYQPTTTSGLQYYRITETTAPDGYLKASNAYIVAFQDGKVNAFGKDKVVSGVHTLGYVKVQTADYAGANIVNGQFVIQDAQKPVVKLRKMSSFTGLALPNAKFSLVETNATGGAYGGSDPIQTQDTLTSGSDGSFQFSPSATTVGSTHYYRLTETTAPGVYAIGKPIWVVYKIGTGLVGVTTDPKTIQPTTSDGPAKVLSSGVIEYTDSPQQYKIQVRRQVPPAGTDTLPQFEKIDQTSSIDIQRTDDASVPIYQLPTDADGNVTVDVAKLAQKLKLDPDSTTAKTVKLKIWIADSDTRDAYTVPATRTVNFTWGANGGFTIDSSNQDKMVADSSRADAENAIPKGDLRLQVRRDTLIAQSAAADTAGTFKRIPNATFTLNYASYGTQDVTTKDSGVKVIQPLDGVPLGKDVTVTVTQTTAANGYEQFVSKNTFNYNSNVGFVLQSFTSGAAVHPQLNPADGTEDPDIDVGVRLIDTTTGISSDQYSFGGTQMTLPLTKILNNLTLNSAPQVMNFGHADVLSGAQTLDLLPKSTDSSKLANFDLSTLTDTDPEATSTVTDADDFLTAKVTQVGTYNSGWQLKMAMSTLTSEDGSDPISGGSVTMGTPKVTKGTDTTDLNMGMSKTVDMNGDEPVINETKITDYADPEDLVNTGNNSTAGVYNIAWNVNDVKMNLPAMVGKLNTNYQSTMSWSLTWAP